MTTLAQIRAESYEEFFDAHMKAIYDNAIDCPTKEEVVFAKDIPKVDAEAFTEAEMYAWTVDDWIAWGEYFLHCDYMEYRPKWMQ